MTLRMVDATQALLLGCTLCACGASGGGGGAGGIAPPDCTTLPWSQGPSEPCCLDHGIDACGAGLVCAALDGRAIPTCYHEHSRGSGDGCSDHRLCLSGSCNPVANACRYLPQESCDLGVGCSDPLDPLAGYQCAAATSTTGLLLDDATCRPQGTSAECSVCQFNPDCPLTNCTDAAHPNGYPLSCVAHRCVGRTGDGVEAQACCENGYERYDAALGCYICN